MAKDLSVEEFLEASSTQVRELALSLRGLVWEVAPDAQEKVYPGWKNIGYTGRRMFCAIAPFKDSVNLYFQQGASLDDPQGLLAGTGKNMRHIKVKKAEDIRPDYFRGLLKQAAELDRREAKP